MENQILGNLSDFSERSENRPPQTENELVHRICQGDKQAEQFLFRHYELLGKIGMMVRQRVKASKEDQRDLVNDIAYSMIINLRKGMFDPDKGSLSTYLWGITRNKIRDYLKPNAARKRNTDLLEEGHLVTYDDTIENNERSRILKKGISQLETKYRQILQLRYFEELTIPEIVEKIDLKPSQVYSRIHYALRLLEEELDT